MIHVLLLATAAAIPLMGLAFAPRLTKAMLKDLRLPRILYFVLLSAMGMGLWTHVQKDWQPWLQVETYFHLAELALGLTLAAVFAIVTNNIEDLPADQVSNPGRPLVRGEVATGPYLRAGILCLIAALVIGFASRGSTGWGIVAISLGYWLYSCRPLRLKRVPFLGKLIIALNSYFAAQMGWTLMGGGGVDFPVIATVLLLGPMALAANFIDLKDVEGDRMQGVSTLPHLLGHKGALMLIGLGTASTYLLGAYMVGMKWIWLPNIAWMFLHLWLLFRTPYKERWVFVAMLLGLAGLVGCLLLPMSWDFRFG